MQFLPQLYLVRPHFVGFFFPDPIYSKHQFFLQKNSHFVPFWEAVPPKRRSHFPSPLFPDSIECDPLVGDQTWCECMVILADWCPIMTPAVWTIMVGRRHVFWEGANSSFQEGYCRSLVEKLLYRVLSPHFTTSYHISARCFQICFIFIPIPAKKWSNLTIIFFKWVGSTTNQSGRVLYVLLSLAQAEHLTWGIVAVPAARAACYPVFWRESNQELLVQKIWL